MQRALSRGFLNATELADYLVGKGVTFREAHHYAGQAVARAEAAGKPLEALSLSELQAICPCIQNDVYAALDYRTAVARRNIHGGTGPDSVIRQLRALQAWLQEKTPGAH